ncbi:MAG: hypothetical protein ACOWWO_12895 [Peptococcaceae bacterium]
MKIPIIALILQGIPEQVAVVTLAFVLAKASIDWKKIILSGIVMAFSAYILRLLPITFWVHTIILIGILFLIVNQVGRVSTQLSLLGSAISFISLLLFEIICVSFLLGIFNISFESVDMNVYKRILVSYPQVLLLFLVSYILYKKGLTLRKFFMKDDFSYRQ